MDLDRNDVGGSTLDGGSMRLSGGKLWKIQVPHKIRHFGWRAAHDILPTKANLFHKYVLLDCTCEKCGVNSESLLHLFWKCLKARET